MTLPTTFLGWVSLLLEKYGPLFLSGAGYTMLIAVVGTAAGFALGLLVAIVRTIPVSGKESWIKKTGLNIASVMLNVYI